MELEQKSLPQLDTWELRVLGVLIEKSKTTPEYYPMTLNGITVACNQKSSRKPVVQYSEEEVIQALDRLKRKGLVNTVSGAGSRALKYRHTIAMQYQLMPEDLAVLCLLILRGPLTPGEINSNANRLYDFESLDEVQQTLNKLMEGDTPFVVLQAKQVGQKEPRYRHLMGDGSEIIEEDNLQENNINPQTNAALVERVSIIEQELAVLKEKFEKLIKELMG